MVEQSPGGDGTPGAGELQYRLQQQSVLAKFGIEALRARDLHPMLQRAVELCAEGMRSRYCKFLEHSADENVLLVRNGVGWREGVVGGTEMRADLGSPAGYAYHMGEPVISNHLENETRFRTPSFMAEHEIRRAINVLVEAGGRRFGVLEVDSPDEGKFEASDLAFMQGFANLIGVAIERQEAERRLNDALAHQELLTREASHRVKNSLAMVSGLLNLQMHADPDERITRLLGDAQARITAIAQAHDRLWRGEQIGMVALDDLIGGIVEQLREQAPQHTIHCDVVHIDISADAAIPIGLLVTELVTNAIKYAYDAGGDIHVSIVERAGDLSLEVRDGGRGLPEGFDLKTVSSKSLGMRMIVSLSRQLHGELAYEDAAPGTRAMLVMPDPRS